MAVTWNVSKGASLMQLMDQLYDSFPYPDHDSRQTPLLATSHNAPPHAPGQSTNSRSTSNGSIGSKGSSGQQYLDSCWRFYLPNDDRPYGYIDPRITDAMPWTADFEIDEGRRAVRLRPVAAPTTSASASIREAANTALDNLWEAAKKVPSPLFDYLRKGWRGEKMRAVGCRDKIEIERAGLSYLGLNGPGSHLNLLTKDKVTGETKVWMQRRALTVKNYPGMLDSTVAGGLTAGHHPVDCIVKEAGEEAGLDAELVRKHMVEAGVVSHWYFLTEDGTLNQPTLNYVFDLEVGEDVTPVGVDGEASGFVLLTLAELKQHLLEGKVKPAAATVAMHLLFRKGGISIRDEPDYVQLLWRLNRMWPMPSTLVV